MLKLISSGLLISLVIANHITLEQKIESDPSLIIPGIGAEQIIIGESTYIANKKFRGLTFKLSTFKEKKSLFANIYNIKSDYQIFYDSIYYYNTKNTILFSYNEKISCIIGYNNERVTIDSVNMNKGVDYFIFNYGNKDLAVIENKTGKIYLYPKLGIAIFDDQNNNSIDLYMIFNLSKI